MTKINSTVPIENMQWILFRLEELYNLQNNFDNK